MGIRIYNTMSRQTEEFMPINEKQVGMYACGITVYDEMHIGHAMQAVVFDIIRKYLEYSGYEVNYVRNFTDVDDKIIQRANEEGIDALELSARYIKSTKEDLDALDVSPATHEPKVSEYIGEIIEFIRGLMDKGHAYPSQGDVLFDITTIKNYGRLSHRKLDDLLNKDSDVKKRNPQDFTLWKAAKEGGPQWDSPWGPGRPGWHIECSAMSRKLLGDSFDIHGGGIDLIFPHHENEIAQSESLTGKEMARYWIHNGLVMVNKQKMSKSLGNFYTVKQALEKFSADEIRYVILGNHYTSNFDFSDEAFRIAGKRVYYFYRTLRQVDQVLAELDSVAEANEKGALLGEFEKAMDENLNSPKALAAVSNAFTEINGLLAGKKKQIIGNAAEFAIFRSDLRKVSGVLGFLKQDPEKYLARIRSNFLSEAGLTESDLSEMISERAGAKQERDFERADRIRKELEKEGIRLLDTPQGTEWDIGI